MLSEIMKNFAGAKRIIFKEAECNQEISKKY